jgi:dihydroxyacid dehydratase/phosphogluconate dehydratase
MCDGVTQGLPGMELSLFSRDTIAMGTADRADATTSSTARCCWASATRSCRAC